MYYQHPVFTDKKKRLGEVIQVAQNSTVNRQETEFELRTSDLQCTFDSTRLAIYLENF